MNKKRIVCFGDSNTWGFCGKTNSRYDDDVRWTTRLSALLGDGYTVIDNGINGRTTVFDDPLNEGLSGLAALPYVLKAHCPIDLFVVMLGTNDCKQRFSATPKNITDGLIRLVKKAKSLEVWRGTPAVLIVAPVILEDKIYTIPVSRDGMGAGSAEKSAELPPLMKQAAELLGCEFLDSNDFARAGESDYVHFDAESHASFAEALAKKIKEII